MIVRSKTLTRERGSAAVEMVLLIPALMAFLGAFVSGAVLLLDLQQVGDAARTGAEAAVDADSPVGARYAATVTAIADLLGGTSTCRHDQVAVNTTAFEPGGSVKVSVRCDATLPGLPFLPVAADVPIESSSIAAVEPYRVVAP